MGAWLTEDTQRQRRKLRVHSGGARGPNSCERGRRDSEGAALMAPRAQGKGLREVGGRPNEAGAPRGPPGLCGPGRASVFLPRSQLISERFCPAARYFPDVALGLVCLRLASGGEGWGLPYRPVPGLGAGGTHQTGQRPAERRETGHTLERRGLYFLFPGRADSFLLLCIKDKGKNQKTKNRKLHSEFPQPAMKTSLIYQSRPSRPNEH